MAAHALTGGCDECGARSRWAWTSPRDGVVMETCTDHTPADQLPPAMLELRQQHPGQNVSAPPPVGHPPAPRRAAGPPRH